MLNYNYLTGFAIALAWPETYCKQAGAWYDSILNWLGIADNNYYKVGHAAVLLVDSTNKKCHYFDFGRYHAPFQHGRVRGSETDHELIFKTKPIFSDDLLKIVNYDELLDELQNKEACHGLGNLYASYTKINFKKSYHKAIEMQNASPIPYGPFLNNGSNCSRFVNTVIRAGEPSFFHFLKLNFFNPLTPTPLLNVNSLSNRTVKPKPFFEEKFSPIKLNTSELKSTLPAPPRNESIPEKALWLSGEGAGSWFDIGFDGKLLNVSRYSPNGVLECRGNYKNPEGCRISENKVQVIYPSNCIIISLLYDDKTLQFKRVLD